MGAEARPLVVRLTLCRRFRLKHGHLVRDWHDKIRKV